MHKLPTYFIHIRNLMKDNKHSFINFFYSIFFILSVTVLGVSSCVSTKSIVYFQGDTARYSREDITQGYIPLIQVSDLLTIVVGSLNPEANEIFNTANQFTTATANYSSAGTGTKNQPLGYLVDSDGNIELPLAGKVRVIGLRTQAAADTIRKRLNVYLKEPTVVVRNVNFKVSVLGEVKNPAVYVIPDERITIAEVLSLAGDLTIYGRRNNVMVIREENGVREYAHLDLTSREIFKSPYYFLHKNDVVYVEPVKARAAATDRAYQLIPIVTGIVSALGILVLNITR